MYFSATGKSGCDVGSFPKESLSQFYLTSTLSNYNIHLFQVLPLSLPSTFDSAFTRRLQCV
jgi:hypothetical protein